MLGFTIVSALPDVRLTTSNGTLANQWYTIGKRVLSVTKASDTSKLRITYQDTVGTRASVHNSCMWRIMLDGNSIASFSDGDVEGTYGWRMHNGAHMAWAFDVPAGTHDVHVEFERLPTATDCLAGWNTTGNFLSVEELP